MQAVQDTSVLQIAYIESVCVGVTSPSVFTLADRGLFCNKGLSWSCKYGLGLRLSLWSAELVTFGHVATSDPKAWGAKTKAGELGVEDPSATWVELP